ncbi:MAG: SigE family RNA polymerase sigma factor [Actinomycetota bacterium]|nr:SigE family RNA polymerase sigma factor [Actinomycetota bacterium]
MRRTRDREEEFKAFYFAEAGKLKRLALLMTGDRDRAEDLTHDALLRTYKAWNRIKNEDPGPYVRTALLNGCRNHLRKRATERRNAPEPVLDAPDASPSVIEALRVAAALEALSPVRRAVVLLRFYEDLPEAQIAQMLDRPLNTIKSDLRRALDQLRPILGDQIREKA